MKILYERICPKCCKKIFYKSKRAYFNCKTLNTKCRSCAANICKKGKQSNRKGCVISDEQKVKLSNAMKKWHNTHTHPMMGKSHTESTIEKFKICNAGKNNPMYGKHHTTESKIKISKANTGKPGPIISRDGLKTLRIKRIAEIEYDKYNGNQMMPSFNKKSCLFFEKLDSFMNWNGIYATKGKEYKIEELGYFVDYYEPKENIIIEWDEPKHYNADGTLIEKDIQRQLEIENLLKCKIIRIKESEFNELQFLENLKNYKDVI